MAELKRRQTKAGEARYDVRVRIGGRVVTRTFKRRKDADDYARLIEADRVRGMAVDPRAGAEKLAPYAARWVDLRRKKGGLPLAPRTVELYGDLLDHHILPTFGRVNVGKITTEAVRGLARRGQLPGVAHRGGQGLPALPRHHGHGRGGRPDRAQTLRIKGAGAESAPERPTVAPGLVLDLADAIDEPYRAMVLLAGFGGLRLGEMLALRSANVDPLHAAVTVEEQRTHLKGGRNLTGAPKSEAGRRTVHVPVVVVEALQHHAATFAPGPGGLVFTGPDGGQLSRGYFYTAWRRAKAEVGAPAELRPHDLRHAGATLAPWTGASTKELMARLGHASPRAALIYQHAGAERDRRSPKASMPWSRPPNGARRHPVRALPPHGPRDGSAMEAR